MIYGREALRQYREQQAQVEHRRASLLEQIPADAPMDDATITVWNGQRWVAWDKWLATAPVVVEESEKKSEAPARAASRPRGQNQGGLW